MKGFAPTAETSGFRPDLLWLGLRSGCRATKSRRLRSESAKLSGATGLPARVIAIWHKYRRINPQDSIGVTDNEGGMVLGALVQYASHCTGQAGLKAQGNQI
jgi:hypothetical protein